MKKCTAVLLALFLCLLCACSPAEEESNMCVYYAPLEFSSVEEMIEFFRAEETDSMERLGYHTSEVKSMEIPNEEAFADAFDAELKSVSLSENGVHYLFSLPHVDVEALAETYLEDRISSLSAEEQQLMMLLFTEFSREILITCDVKSEDGTTLAGAASGGQVKRWEEHPDFSYAEANFGDMGEGESYGYYLYWNDFGNSFFARIPAHLVDSFFEHYDSLIETAKVQE